MGGITLLRAAVNAGLDIAGSLLISMLFLALLPLFAAVGAAFDVAVDGLVVVLRNRELLPEAADSAGEDTAVFGGGEVMFMISLRSGRIRQSKGSH